MAGVEETAAKVSSLAGRFAKFAGKAALYVGLPLTAIALAVGLSAGTAGAAGPALPSIFKGYSLMGNGAVDLTQEAINMLPGKAAAGNAASCAVPGVEQAAAEAGGAPLGGNIDGGVMNSGPTYDP